jgi:uncharacterized YigZ family protein
MKLPIRYPIPAAPVRVETIIKGSHFLASMSLAETREQADAQIKAWKAEFSDATHNCPAYRIGYGPSAMEWASDDGEPAGTAGKPMLSVLQGTDLGDVVVVVTRYSSGIKLGTGGLVRAYSGMVRQALESLETIMRVEREPYLLACDYGRYERLKELLSRYEVNIEQEDFGTDILLEMSIPVDRVEECQTELTEFSLGQLTLEAWSE